MNIYRSKLRALDDHLQKPNFAALEALTVGLSQDHPGTPDTMAEYFPRTAARGLLRIMDIVTMERSVATGKGAVSMEFSTARVQM